MDYEDQRRYEKRADADAVKGLWFSIEIALILLVGVFVILRFA